MSKTSPCNVDDELLNFNDMQYMIKTRHFYSMAEGQWGSHISSNLLVYESLDASDCEFIAQVLTAIDTMVNFWL